MAKSSAGPTRKSSTAPAMRAIRPVGGRLVDEGSRRRRALLARVAVGGADDRGNRLVEIDVRVHEHAVLAPQLGDDALDLELAVGGVGAALYLQAHRDRAREGDRRHPRLSDQPAAELTVAGQECQRRRLDPGLEQQLRERRPAGGALLGRLEQNRAAHHQGGGDHPAGDREGEVPGADHRRRRRAIEAAARFARRAPAAARRPDGGRSARRSAGSRSPRRPRRRRPPRAFRTRARSGRRDARRRWTASSAACSRITARSSSGRRGHPAARATSSACAASSWRAQRRRATGPIGPAWIGGRHLFARVALLPADHHGGPQMAARRPAPPAPRSAPCATSGRRSSSSGSFELIHQQSFTLRALRQAPTARRVNGGAAGAGSPGWRSSPAAAGPGRPSRPPGRRSACRPGPGGRARLSPSAISSPRPAQHLKLELLRPPAGPLEMGHRLGQRAKVVGGDRGADRCRARRSERG